MLIEQKPKLPLEMMIDTITTFDKDLLSATSAETFFYSNWNSNETIDVYEGVLFKVYGNEGQFIVEMGHSQKHLTDGEKQSEYKLTVFRYFDDFTETLLFQTFKLKDYAKLLNQTLYQIQNLSEKTLDKPDDLLYTDEQ